MKTCGIKYTKHETKGKTSAVKALKKYVVNILYFINNDFPDWKMP